MRKLAGTLLVFGAMAASLPAKAVTVFSTATLKCGSTVSLTLTGVTFNFAQGGTNEKSSTSMIVYFPMSSTYATYEEYSRNNVEFPECTIVANVAGSNGLPAAVTWKLTDVKLPSINATAGGPSTLEGLTEPFATVALTLTFFKETVSSAE